MKKYICRITYESTANDGTRLEAETCCLVHAESPELIEDPLRDLLRRLRDKGSLRDANEIFLDHIVELAEGPGDAVLWYISTRGHPDGNVHISAALLIDDSGEARCYGYGKEPEIGDMKEPFMVLSDETPVPPRRARSKASRASGATRRRKVKA
jgi:hypothetical protein